MRILCRALFIAHLARAHTRALKTIQIFAAELRLAGDVHAQLAHDGQILFGQDAGAVRLAPAQADEHVHRLFRDGVGRRADGERRQNVAQVELDLILAQNVLLQLNDRREHDGRKQQHAVGNARKRFDRVEHGLPGRTADETRVGINMDLGFAVSESSENQEAALAFLSWMSARTEEETVLYSELGERLHAALGKVPPPCREAFEMNRFKRMKYQEIADMLGVSKRTVESRIGKTLAILRVELKDFLMILLLFSGIPLW